MRNRMLLVAAATAALALTSGCSLLGDEPGAPGRIGPGESTPAAEAPRGPVTTGDDPAWCGDVNDFLRTPPGTEAGPIPSLPTEEQYGSYQRFADGSRETARTPGLPPEVAEAFEVLARFGDERAAYPLGNPDRTLERAADTATRTITQHLRAHCPDSSGSGEPAEPDEPAPDGTTGL